GGPAFVQLVAVARAGLTGLAGAGLPARTAGIADVREHAVHRSPHPGERLRGRVAVLHDGLACSPGLDVTGEDSVKKRVRVGKRMRELDTVDFAPAPALGTAAEPLLEAVERAGQRLERDLVPGGTFRVGGGGEPARVTLVPQPQQAGVEAPGRGHHRDQAEKRSVEV